MSSRPDTQAIEPWIVPGSDHTDAIERATTEYERRLDAFFEAALAGD